MQSPAWRKTLLIITYDEHGGFFDHVASARPAADDQPTMRPLRPARAGDRRLALRRAGSVSKTVFDHTSIIKTILTRFCRQPDGKIPDMGTARRRRQPPRRAADPLDRRRRIKRADYQHLVDDSARWHEEMVLDGVPQPGEGLAIPHELTDFQKDFLGAKARRARRPPPVGGGG